MYNNVMRLKILLMLPVFLFYIRGYAQENTITLEAAVEEAKQNNPGIKAARQRYLAALKNVTYSKTWEYPLLGAEFDSQIKNMFIISQQIPFPGKLSLKGRMARGEAGLARAELGLKLREVIDGVKKSYWKYWQAGKNMEIYRENLDLLKRVSGISRSLYEVGKVPLSDVFKANVEIGKSESQLVVARQERISAQAELAAQLNRSTGSAPGNPVQPGKTSLEYSLDDLLRSASENSPGSRAKKYSYDRSKAGAALARFGWVPDFYLGARIGDNYTDYIAQVTLPVFFWKQAAGVSRAVYERDAALLDLESQRAGLVKDVTGLYARFVSHDESAVIYETNIIPMTKQALSLTEEGYRSRKNSIIDLLDSQKRYLDYSIEYYIHVVERESVLAELESLSGAGPEGE
ncbi:TolC family protein [bacterium]|nr:MAG: TolC family protein [bacterium]